MFNMCNLKIAYKIMAFVVLTLIFIGVVGYTGYYFTNQTNLNMSKMYSERLLPTYELNSLQTQFRGNEANLLYLIHYSNNKKLQDERKKDIEKRVNTAKDLVTEFNTIKLTPEEQKLYTEFNNHYETYRPIRQKVIELALAGKSKEANDLFMNNKILFDQITAKLAELSDLNTSLAKHMKEESQKDYQMAINSIMITIAIAVIVSLIFGLVLSIRISKPLNKLMNTLLAVSEGNLMVERLEDKTKDEIGCLSAASNKMVENLRNLVKEVISSVYTISADSEEMNAAADQTSQGAEQIANSVNQLANGATQISHSISELANGANEIVRSVEKGAENINSMDSVINKISTEANNIATLTSNTEQNANEGSQYVKKAVNKIGSIKEVATEISHTINELGQLGSEIEQIVDLIKGIASQTNLLALNAAIEAARAGEHGKGFAVVAEEVKKLAGQSADATDKITTMIKDIQNKTNVAVDIMNKTVHEVDEGVIIINDAGSALENIIDRVKEANLNIQFVTKEIDEVAHSSKVVVEMVQKISQITEVTANNAQEIASITEETAASAEEISSVTEEQTSSLEEINNSTKSLVSTVEALQQKVSSFKVEDSTHKPDRFYANNSKLNKLTSLELKTA